MFKIPTVVAFIDELNKIATAAIPIPKLPKVTTNIGAAVNKGNIIKPLNTITPTNYTIVNTAAPIGNLEQTMSQKTLPTPPVS
jgi:hypothetical protein